MIKRATNSWDTQKASYMMHIPNFPMISLSQKLKKYAMN